MGDVTTGCGWANWGVLGGFTFGQCKQPPQDPSGALHEGSCCVHSGISWSGVDCQDDCPYGYTNEMFDVTSGCGWLNALTWLGGTAIGKCTQRPPIEAMNDAYLTSALMSIVYEKEYEFLYEEFYDTQEWNENNKALRDYGYNLDEDFFEIIEAEDTQTFGENGAHIIYFFAEHGGNNELVIGFPGSRTAHDILVTDLNLALNGDSDTTEFVVDGETFYAGSSVVEHYESTRKDFLDQMDEYLDKSCVSSCVDVIRLVGHSLGGTAAQFGAIDMVKRYGEKYNIWLSTYASPRAFDSSSSDRVHSLLTTNGNRANRYMLYGDIIPWGGKGLKHVGDAYFIEKAALHEKDQNYMPLDTKAIFCCPGCKAIDDPLSGLYIGVGQYISCLRENHSMEDYLYNINLIKNDNRKYLEDEKRVPSRDATRECPFFEESCSDIDTDMTDTQGSQSMTWIPDLASTSIIGDHVNYGDPVPATISFSLGDNVWIIGGMDNGLIKMVKIEITNVNTFNWIGSAYTDSGSCMDQSGFSESCFTDGVDRSASVGGYDVSLVAYAQETKLNIVEENQAGSWGGSCTCPDGSVYQVGDNDDYCGSLACVGGISGECNESDGPWSGRKVTCAGSFRRRSLKY